MQSDQSYNHPPQEPYLDFVATPPHAYVNGYVTSPADMFALAMPQVQPTCSHTLCPPTTASAFANGRNFWGGGAPNTTAMDVDYSAVGSNAFQTPMSVVCRQMEYMVEPRQPNPARWSRLQPMVEQGLAPCLSSPTSMDNPFGIVDPGVGVDPGLLFTRPPSSNMYAMASAPQGPVTDLMSPGPIGYDQPRQLPGSSGQDSSQMSQGSPRQNLVAIAPAGVRKELRRSASVKDPTPRRKVSDRTLAGSPAKTIARPGLSRRFYKSMGPKLRGRASLPTLAPAIKPVSPVSAPQPLGSAGGDIGLRITRSASIAGGRISGRVSPIKPFEQRQQDEKRHGRLASLTPIPEINMTRRASIEFTVDANGRARVETKVDGGNELLMPPPNLKRNQSARSLRSKSLWDSSSDYDASSIYGEMIAIPNRTTSFALAGAIKPTIGRGLLHSPRRSVSGCGTTRASATLSGDHGLESEPANLPRGAGDAAHELEKLRQQRQRRGKSANSVPGSAQKGLRFGLHSSNGGLP